MESRRLLDNNGDSLSRNRHWNSCSLAHHFCLPSKAARLILLWTVAIGIIYYIFIGLAIESTYTAKGSHVAIYESITYAMLAFIMMLYPLSGLVADVCCGRLKTVAISLTVFLVLLFVVICIYIISTSMRFFHISRLSNMSYIISNAPGTIVFILFVICILLFVVGLSGYQANYIQLGLDQLFEAPSRYLSLFIHYAILAFYISEIPVLAVDFFEQYVIICTHINTGVHHVWFLLLVVSLLTLILFALLVISFWKRRWFISDSGQTNPYKTVFKVISFAWKHKNPLRRTAFAYSDDYVPTRLDFAKERFGGPFTTEQVEDVKVLRRIIAVLFAMGPVFVLEMPGSEFVFPIFGLHTLHQNLTENFAPCDIKFEEFWQLAMASGVFMIVTSMIVLFPFYIWIIFCHLRNRMPKVFTRMGIGIVLSLIGVASMLMVDVAGHSLNSTSDGNQTQCMFRYYTSHKHGHHVYPVLNMHWAVLIAPSLFLRIGPLLMVATTLEFISAQSPHSMKGVLIGIFFSIRGLFQFLNSITIIPLSLKRPWAVGKMIEDPPVTNCGFVYLLLTFVVGLTGLIMFSLAAKRYTYRVRDEGQFRQYAIEEIYDRYITQAVENTREYSSDDCSD